MSDSSSEGSGSDSSGSSGDEMPAGKNYTGRYGGGGGGGGLFNAYMAAKERQDRQDQQQQDQQQRQPAPSFSTVGDFLKKMASDRQWKEDELAADLAFLDKNRLRTWQDLSALSESSWTQLELPMLVKDLLRKQLASELNSVPDSTTQKQPDSTTLRAFELSEASSSRHSEPALNTGASLGARIVVRGSDGRPYEIDRYCPHRGADLYGAQIVDNKVICPKHKWAFDLSRGGTCAKKPGSSIHACPLESTLPKW